MGFLGRRKATDTIRRILIVEDEPLIAFDNEHFLVDAGFEVVATVDNAADAMRMIEAGGVDLVVTDVRLAGDGDGIDVARAAADAEIAVMFVTGNCPGEAQSFADGCLSKPYAQKDLVSAIAAVATRRAGRRIGRLPKGFTLFEKD